MNNMTSFEKRECVKKDYDLIAEQYGNEFGLYIEDLDVYEEFEKKLSEKARILDLGAGTGRTYSYFNQKGYEYIGIDFSKKMKETAYKIHGAFPYIIDDMVNIKKHFQNNSFDAIFAVYSLFHLPNEDFKKVLSDIYDLLKVGGVFLFSYQKGKDEEMVDEPYLNEKGKKVLYMNYQTDEEVKELLNTYSYKEIYRKEKIETLDSAINNDKAVTVFMIVKK